jgi:class 3 adenylate cyclase
LSALRRERKSALRELELGALQELELEALQVWQSRSEATGRGQGDQQMAVLLTDLVGLSSLSLPVSDALLARLNAGVLAELRTGRARRCGPTAHA